MRCPHIDSNLEPITLVQFDLGPSKGLCLSWFSPRKNYSETLLHMFELNANHSLRHQMICKHGIWTLSMHWLIDGNPKTKLIHFNGSLTIKLVGVNHNTSFPFIHMRGACKPYYE